MAAMGYLVPERTVQRLDESLRRLAESYAADCAIGCEDAASLARTMQTHVADTARRLDIEPEVVWCALRLLIRA